MGAKGSEKEMERVLKALANRRRLAILDYIRQKKEASVGVVAEHMKLSFKATSKHLALLVAAGALDKEQRSSQMFFRLAPDMPEAARRILSLI